MTAAAALVAASLAAAPPKAPLSKAAPSKAAPSKAAPLAAASLAAGRGKPRLVGPGDRPAGTGPGDRPGGAGAVKFLGNVLPYVTVVIAAFAPLAAGLYLITTLAWSGAERWLFLRRAVLSRVPRHLSRVPSLSCPFYGGLVARNS
jgi:YidC/Oxa1 family membrane protein insertase